MIKINLIPPEYIEKLNRKVMIAKAVFGGVLIFAAVAVVSLWHVTRSKTLESDLVRLQVELKQLQGDVDKVKAIEAQIAEVQRYLDAINRITRGRMTYTQFLQDILVDLPGTIWFGGFSSSMKGNEMTVTFAVNSRSAYDLAYWINALETSGKFTDVSIGGISASDDESGRIFITSLSLKSVLK